MIDIVLEERRVVGQSKLIERALHHQLARAIGGHKVEQAAAFGATHIVNSSNVDPAPFLSELSEGKGIDGVVDVTGNAGVRQVAYDATSNTGRTIFAGVPHFEETITIDSFPLHFGRQVFGSHGGDTKPDVDIPRYVRLYKLGKLRLDEQITHRFKLDDINEAVDTVMAGDAGRSVVEMLG